MAVTLKPLSQQVIVITGASSGIGLAAARRAARAGAKVVLVARNEDALVEAVESIRLRGGRATHLAIDVSEAGAPEKIGQVAHDTFGGFDTWVNDAAVALYADLLDTGIDEQRRVFDVGYFATVAASLYAAERLTARGGGAIINLGSILSDRSVPKQGAYSAMKHAVQGFTESLRMEIESDGRPVSVTLVKPAGIDTPYPEHARNRMSKPARIPPVVYDPELVAKAICFAAEHPKRDLTVGGSGLFMTKMSNLMPRSADRVMEAFFGETAQSIDQPAEAAARDNLFEPRADGRERSNKDMYVRKQSLALEAQMRPWTTLAILGGVGAAAGMLLSLRGSSAKRPVALLPAPDGGAHQADGTDASASFAAGIADEGTVPGMGGTLDTGNVALDHAVAPDELRFSERPDGAAVAPNADDIRVVEPN
ncbi:SDR family oxidoreductase [Sphingomonas sp. CFBP 13720]|uniref:SDR family oxidoreductase n=1 Tax=Sphingomonas sp. CFBP 13720 TaxID=2775302 RepID=UPI0017843B76|nr:SDR family oxidoreductase [Sphingomonas sp. CFBP 13720]MBD8677967.1 SDR family NAD(P)-dependent oxidoreductase [Sphingomonas sp. CFBP 13720]